MRDAFESAAVGLALLDADGCVAEANASLRNMLGYDAREIRGLSLNAAFRADGGVREGLLSSMLAGDGHYRGEGRLGRKDGGDVLVKIEVSPLWEDGGRGVAVIEDITRARRVEEAFAESEVRFRQLFENSVDALLMHDEEGRILDCNVEACRSLGYTRAELLSLSVRDIAVDVMSEEQQEAVGEEAAWRRAMRGRPGAVVGTYENRHRRKDGTTFPVEVALASMDYEGRRVIFAAARDISERKALEERLTYQAFHDSLTGLPNRALFLDRLEQALARADRREFSIAVFFLDLDNFKDINDTFGHEVGDRLLAEVGSRLTSCVRAADTVARLAGDEFTVLLEELGNGDEAVRVVERIETIFQEPVTVNGRDLSVTASIGVVVDAQSGRSPRELLNDADIAMYRAKRAGKARYEIHVPGDSGSD